MEGKCKLCHESKELIKRSHLFPNFMYNGIPDEKNRMIVVSSAKPLEKKQVQTGALDEHILCANCDNSVLGELERYASNIFYKKSYLQANEDFEQLTPNPNVNLIFCKKIDFSKFKLFLESLLWRASVTSHSMFEDFKLSDEQEEELRISILNHHPLNEASFPCVMMTCENEDVKTDFVGIDPNNKDMVKFYINQFTYTFYWGNDKINYETISMALRSDNTMIVVKLAENDWHKIRASIVDAFRTASVPNLPKK